MGSAFRPEIGGVPTLCSSDLPGCLRGQLRGTAAGVRPAASADAARSRQWRAELRLASRRLRSTSGPSSGTRDAHSPRRQLQNVSRSGGRCQRRERSCRPAVRGRLKLDIGQHALDGLDPTTEDRSRPHPLFTAAGTLGGGIGNCRRRAAVARRGTEWSTAPRGGENVSVTFSRLPPLQRRQHSRWRHWQLE